jgi:uncharacterized protein (DUF1786 family)
MTGLKRGGPRILAIDVGAGTQDILYYDPENEPENNVKLVLPSQTQILARKISGLKDDLLITGEIMGGGPVAMAIKRHLKKGHRVLMTETSAKTVRDNLDEVRADGIEIVGDAEADGLDMERIEAGDVDLDFLLHVISIAGKSEPDFIGIAVQDHGYRAGKSDRAFRFEKIQQMLERGARLEDFFFEKPPEYYTRMGAVVRYLRKNFNGGVAVIDSKFAAIAGAMHDVSDRPCLCIDVGNGHTMAALVDGFVGGIFEHHTQVLTGENLANYVIRLANGEVTNREVFNDDGHGCFIKKAPGYENIKRVLVSGPRRKLLKDSGLALEYASPYGDVMMTGPVGIVDLVRAKFF